MNFDCAMLKGQRTDGWARILLFLLFSLYRTPHPHLHLHPPSTYTLTYSFTHSLTPAHLHTCTPALICPSARSFVFPFLISTRTSRQLSLQSQLVRIYCCLLAHPSMSVCLSICCAYPLKIAPILSVHCSFSNVKEWVSE